MKNHDFHAWQVEAIKTIFLLPIGLVRMMFSLLSPTLGEQNNFVAKNAPMTSQTSRDLALAHIQ